MDSVEKRKTRNEWTDVEMDSLIIKKEKLGMDYSAPERRDFRNEGMEIIRLALMLLIMVLLLGYIMVWIIMPVNTYGLLYLPDIYAKGEQG